MALTKLTTVLNKISTLATLIEGQATVVKTAFDYDVNIVKDYINDTLTPELDSNFETKDNITTNRKLSTTGNFTGTWNGYTPTQTDPGIQAVVDGHTSQLADIAVNITKYWSVPNDPTKALINAAAIQSAIDYCFNKGGGTVIIPSGKLYYVAPDAITMKSNVTLSGYGATLKLIDNVGDFWTLITLATNHHDIKILGLTIDMNDAKTVNVSGDIRILPAIACHATIYGGGISNLYIEDNIILNTAGIQTILVDGYNTNYNVNVINNQFVWVRGKGSSLDVGNGWYDNTIVYLNGYTHTKVIGNSFKSDYLSRCNNCLDVNGKDIKVIGNSSDKIPHFMDIDIASDGLIIQDNYLYDVTNGITIWEDCNNAIISKNQMYLNAEVYKSNNPNLWDDFHMGAVVWYSSGTRLVKDIVIKDNMFANVASTYVAGVVSKSAVIHMLNMVVGTPLTTYDGLFIEDNAFYYFNGQCIVMNTGANGGTIRGTVKGNKFVDCGKLALSSIIYLTLTSAKNQLTVKDNEVYADHNYLHSFISLMSYNIDNTLKVINNNFNIKNGDIGIFNYPIEFFDANKLSIVDKANIVHSHFDTRILSIHGGDIVVQADGTYKVTEFGTIGTLGAITISGTLGQYGNVTAVGNITALKAGDYISCATHSLNKWCIGYIDYTLNKIYFNELPISVTYTVTNDTLLLGGSGLVKIV